VCERSKTGHTPANDSNPAERTLGYRAEPLRKSTSPMNASQIDLFANCELNGKLQVEEIIFQAGVISRWSEIQFSHGDNL
jgi:hypothetical protein